jgi:hypothetical protein
MDENNEKALFRKGVCLARAGMHHHAIKALELCKNSKPFSIRPSPAP